MSLIETSLTCQQLKRRHQAAWWRTRRIHPIVGVTFDLENARFRSMDTVAEAKKWASDTCRVATNTSVYDAYLERSRQTLDATTMTLVSDPARGSRGCVLNISHTLSGHVGFHIMQEFLTQLANPDTELGIDGIFTPEHIFDVKPYLPQSLSHAYSLIHQATPKDLQEVLQSQERAQQRWQRSSIGVPLHPDWKNRPSRIHNKSVRFEPEETRAALKCFKRLGITLTTAFFACMTSAMAQKFGTGDEEGAHLLFSGNARRWVDLNGRDGRGPITMAIIPGGMWIDADTVDIRAKDKAGLIRLAKAIQKAQNEDLVSPHVIAVWDQLAPDMAKAMGDSAKNNASVPAISRPTLTSQGFFDDKRVAAGSGHDLVRMTDFNTGGRNTDPNVCFALNSFRDELRYNLLFDERFFVQDDVMQLAYGVSGLFRCLISDEPVLARL